MRRHNVHVESIVLVAQQLSKLDIDFVFTGGSIVGLLLTDSAAPDVRPTDDVDVIVSAASYAMYSSLQQKLRSIGFNHDIHGPTCRFSWQGLKVDVMPSDGKVLGFTNNWYEFAIATAAEYSFPDGTAIRLVTAPAFVATKLDAFFDRGKADYSLSHDLEDVIAVIDGRPELLGEIENADPTAGIFIAQSLSLLLATPGFVESVGLYLMPDEASQARASVIIDRMRQISKLVPRL